MNRCVTEFRSDEAPPPESANKSIVPLPNENLPNLPHISQSNGEGAAVEFEMNPGSNAEPSDTSMGYGLNLRRPSATGSDAPSDNYVFSDMVSWRFRENLGNLSDGPGLDVFEDVSVGKVVLIVNGRFMGMKGKIVDVRNGGDLLVVRMSKSNEKVKLERQDVVEVGSAEEEKCLRRSKELRVKIDRHKHKDTDRSKSERVNWLRNDIRVRVNSEKLKGMRLYLKKGVVVDVVGPGVCNILIDESGELVEGVDQDFLETALPMRGGRVLVLCGRHRGVCGALVERDSQNQTCVVKDGHSHELLNVKLHQVAEYVGDPSHIAY